jgi:lipid-A-disaccharide synthase
MRSLKELFPECRFSGIGGVAMEREGLQSLVPMREISVVGFWEVAKRYPMFRGLLRKCSSILASGGIDAFIPVDYPGFNMRLAKAAKQAGVPVVWYIAPQLWAWGEQRAEALRAVVDKLLVVFPFEEGFFRKHGINTRFVGHPLVDVPEIQSPIRPLPERLTDTGLREVALLPGSRSQEIRNNLSVMLEASSLLYSQESNLTFTLAAAPNLDVQLLKPFFTLAEKTYRIPLTLESSSHALFRRAAAGIVKTGTSTLEAALCGLPHAMMYRTSPLSYRLAKRVVRLSHIALPNVLMEKEQQKPALVREFIQDAAKPRAIADELLWLLNDEVYAKRMTAGFEELRDMLGVHTGLAAEPVSLRAAREIAECL